ncbi:MAG: sigma-70 family RNA polymerase sigma factor [Lysobacterales bacterium]
MGQFETTRWSIVLQARGGPVEARGALETLCRTYRAPVLAYIRRRTGNADDADDLAQTFFTSFVADSLHANADPARGRFRAYLLTAVKRFLIDQHLRATRLKRGGGVQFEPVDEGDAASLGHDDGPDKAFEHDWAIAVLDGAMTRLNDEAEAAGKRDLFLHLREFLIERPDDADYSRIATELGLRRNTVAVAVHRLRHRLRELVREEIGETTSSREELDAELHDLRGAIEKTIVE